ncbi:MAG: hypothetical protein R3195_13390 [Gemmatimonadota bacterium]|nr:hypothetical protein [Gemmatimonadota bacterium]
MQGRCLYCGHSLGGVAGIASVRTGGRIAFDPERARIWTVCERCHGWNLWWRDDGGRTLEALERLARDRARVLYETDHVSLLQAPSCQLVRVGPAPRRESAWWRYGRRLRRRHDRFQSPVTQVATATYSAVSSVGISVGLGSVTGDFRRAVDRRVEVLRWRRFGGTAWAGRAPCPNCGSVLIRLFFMKCSDLVLFTGPDGRPAVGMPCARCDPWSTEETHRFEPALVEPLLRRVLAWHNIDGATTRDLDRSVGLIESQGSAERFIEHLARVRLPLHQMDHVERLALEIAVNDRAEHESLMADAARLEAGWRRADEIATIIEEEL